MTETHIDIDSTYRDRKLYPNPFDMKIERTKTTINSINNSRNIVCDTYPNNGIMRKIIKSNIGAIYKVTLQNKGQDYNNQNVTIIGGNNDCIISIPDLKIINPGSHYTSGTYTVSGTGKGMIVNVENIGTSIEFQNESILSFIDITYIDFIVCIDTDMYTILSKINNYIIIKSITAEYRDDIVVVFHKFTEDGVKSIKPGKNESKRYDMSLMSLIVPNISLNNKTYNKKNIVDWPYILLQFYSGTDKQSNYESNNPNIEFATFKCIVCYVDKNYIRLNAITSCINKFNMSTDITFKILSPDGKVLKYNREDYKIPQRPDEKMQISATIKLREI